MPFSHKAILRKNKHGNYNNSTKSCQVLVNPSNKLEITEAFSYDEKIAFIDHKKKIIVYNARKFSTTTSTHFYAIRSVIESKHSIGYKSFYFEIDSLNGYCPKSIKSILDDKSLKYSESLFEAFGLKIFKGIKKLKQIEDRTNKEIKEKRESKNLSKLRDKVRWLDYKTETGLLKAIKTITDKTGSVFFEIHKYTLFESVMRFKNILKDHFILDDFIHINLLEFYRIPRENLDDLKYLVDLMNYGEINIWKIHYAWHKDSILKYENKDFMLYLESKNFLNLKHEETLNVLNQVKAMDCLNNLGD
jgi:hypothetical protein